MKREITTFNPKTKELVLYYTFKNKWKDITFVHGIIDCGSVLGSEFMSGCSGLAGKLMAGDGSKLDVELVSGGVLAGNFVIVSGDGGRLAGNFVVIGGVGNKFIITSGGNRLVAEFIIAGSGGSWLDSTGSISGIAAFIIIRFAGGAGGNWLDWTEFIVGVAFVTIAGGGGDQLDLSLTALHGEWQ